MGDLSRHFSSWEFSCKGHDCCGGCAPMHPDLVNALEALRHKAGRPLYINSGFRCLTHNRRIGSKDTSQHCLGKAADVRLPEGMTCNELADMAAEVPAFRRGGIIIYGTFVHVDVRNEDKPVRYDNH